MCRSCLNTTVGDTGSPFDSPSWQIPPVVAGSEVRRKREDIYIRAATKPMITNQYIPDATAIRINLKTMKMRMNSKNIIIMAMFFLCCIPAQALTVSSLRTQALTNPVGIDVAKPVFSWIIASDGRGVRQKSYEICVATDAGFGNVVWRSGVVRSDESVHVPYKGAALQPSTRYFWKVKVRDNKGNTATSAETAYFETGLMGTGWSGAKWIKAGEGESNGAAQPVPSGDRKLRYTVETDLTILKDNAGIVFSYDGPMRYMMWAINTYNVQTPVIRRHVYNGNATPAYSDTPITAFSKADIIGKRRHLRIEVTGNLIQTYLDDVLLDEFTDDSGVLRFGDVGFRVSHGSSEDEKAYFDNLRVTSYDAGGSPEVVLFENFEQQFSPYFDKITIKEVDGNSVAYVYSGNGEQKFMQNSTKGAPMFRKLFTTQGKVASAKLYTTALGVYDLWLNGKRVGHLQDDGSMKYEELKPGWTDYNKKVFYDTHDVTSLIAEGDNALGAVVTPGWWNGAICHGEYGSPSLGFMAKLVITYDSGHTETIVTDGSWLCSTGGPIRRGEIYDGESYDARLAFDWTNPHVTKGDWQPVAFNNEFKGEVTAFEGPAVEVRHELEHRPKHVTVYEGTVSTGTAYGMVNVISEHDGPGPVALKKGQTVIYDFGQNAVGWVRFTAEGRNGTRLRFRFSEMLNDKGDTGRGDDGPGGSLYLINLRTAAATMYYVMSGKDGGETFQPSTTFFGFRYCEVTATDDVVISSIAGQVVGSALAEGSSLTTSHPAVNRLYSNVQWGQRSNFLSIPTDCPQRDERLGWTADTQIFSRAATYNADCAAFYHKWMGDMRDSQRDDGAYPDVAPHAWVGYGNGAWGDAGIVLPWNVYLMYGDRSIIEENYPSMEKYMAWMAEQTGDGYKYQGAGTAYGDWVSFVPTDSRYVSVCYYAYDAQLMAKMSRVMSTAPGDEYALKAMKYEQLFEAIKAEFATRYLSDGVPTQHTQTGYLLALKFNLLPDAGSVAKTVACLDRLIADNGNMLNTGFVGTGILNQTLTEVGLTDRAYNLLLQRKCPSWLYSVDQGATTIWERWDSYTIDRGFHRDITMNSFNHYAYGAVAEWMFRFMAGIEADENKPGFKHIILQPTPDNRKTMPDGQQRITSVDATYRSDYGDVKSAWKRMDDGTIALSVTVPANTTATLYYPVASPDASVKESGTDAANAEGVEFVGYSDGKAVYNLLSGTYRFSSSASSAASHK